MFVILFYKLLNLKVFIDFVVVLQRVLLLKSVDDFLLLGHQSNLSFASDGQFGCVHFLAV
jgi:hypothetical protein